MDKLGQCEAAMYMLAATNDCGFEPVHQAPDSPDPAPLRLSSLPKHERAEAGSCFASDRDVVSAAGDFSEISLDSQSKGPSVKLG